MIEIIPLKKEDLDISKIESINIDSSYIFSTTTNIISKLITYDNYPISKNKAIIKILNFLNFFDVRLWEYEERSTSLNNKILRKYFRDHKPYMDILYALGIIKKKKYEDGSYYKVGSKSIQYEYFSNYDQHTPCLVIIKGNRKITHSFENCVDMKFLNTIANIQLDIRVAIKAEINYYLADNISLRQLQSRLSIALNILSNRKLSQSERTGRIRHSFCTLSKVARKHISFNGQRFYEMDVATCQPLLLAYFLKSQDLPIDDEYLRDVQTGKVYDVIADKIGKNRDETKVDLYKSIFFDFKPSKNKAGKTFLDAYNLTAMSINYFMQTSEDTMASILQSLEANIFNKLQVNHSEAYFTLYDAIYFTSARDIDYLEQQIINAFSVYKLKVNIKIV